MRGVRTTLLVVAAAMCLAALLTPVASANGSPSPTITGITVTGLGSLGVAGTTYCRFGVEVSYTSHLNWHDSWAFMHSNSASGDEMSGPIGKSRGSFGFQVSFLEEPFLLDGTSYTFTASILNWKNVSDILAEATTAPYAATGSCPSGPVASYPSS